MLPTARRRPVVTGGAQRVDQFCSIDPTITATYAASQEQAIRAELTGDSQCRAEGITVRSGSPVLEMCRVLVRARFDTGRPLHAYRGTTLSLIVCSIGEAATLDVNSKGTGFVRHRQSVRIAAPIAPSAEHGVFSTGGAP